MKARRAAGGLLRHLTPNVLLLGCRHRPSRDLPSTGWGWAINCHWWWTHSWPHPLEHAWAKIFFPPAVSSTKGTQGSVWRKSLIWDLASSFDVSFRSLLYLKKRFRENQICTLLGAWWLLITWLLKLTFNVERKSDSQHYYCYLGLIFIEKRLTW